MEGLSICSYENCKAASCLKKILTEITFDSNYEITFIKFEK